METKVSCCDIFGLCLSVVANIGLLLGFIFVAQDLFRGERGDLWQIGLFNLVLITTNTILLIFELKSIRGKSIKKWNLVMRIIWTVVVGLIVILYLIQLISCTNHSWGACLIWDRVPYIPSVLIFSICLLIVGPMFLYGISKSFLLHKVLKAQSDLPQQLGLPLTRL